MKKKFLFSVIILVLLLVLSGCSIYPEETRMAKEYLGMTFGEIKELWGNDCTLGGDLYDGAKKGVCYADSRTPYIFLFEEEPADLTSLSDDAIVTRVRAESGKGRPCETMENETVRGDIQNKYYVGHSKKTDTYFANGLNLRDETVIVSYFYAITNSEEAEEKGEKWQEVKARDFNASSFAYEVVITPEEYRQKQYYHDTTDTELNFFYHFGIWPPEDWEGEVDIPFNFYTYFIEYNEWSDPDAVEEYIETGVWPEDAYLPYPYDDIERVYFKTEHGFWPPDNWDYSLLDSASASYYHDYKEWADPDAYEEFMETGHWPEDAYVPYPYSDPALLNQYHMTGEWPEGTDLSELPPLPNK